MLHRGRGGQDPRGERADGGPLPAAPRGARGASRRGAVLAALASAAPPRVERGAARAARRRQRVPRRDLAVRARHRGRPHGRGRDPRRERARAPRGVAEGGARALPARVRGQPRGDGARRRRLSPDRDERRLLQADRVQPVRAREADLHGHHPPGRHRRRPAPRAAGLRGRAAQLQHRQALRAQDRRDRLGGADRVGDPRRRRPPAQGPRHRAGHQRATGGARPRAGRAGASRARPRPDPGVRGRGHLPRRRARPHHVREPRRRRDAGLEPGGAGGQAGARAPARHACGGRPLSALPAARRNQLRRAPAQRCRPRRPGRGRSGGGVLRRERARAHGDGAARTLASTPRAGASRPPRRSARAGLASSTTRRFRDSPGCTCCSPRARARGWPRRCATASARRSSTSPTRWRSCAG